MFKFLPFLLIAIFSVNVISAQNDSGWTPVPNSKDIRVSKTAQRETFPESFKLFETNLDQIRTILANAPERFSSARNGVIITLPNVSGSTERFEMFEASNFDPSLQKQFPQIRSYAGKGIDDKNAIIRLSLDQNGIQTMVFRSGSKNEFMERYSEDGKIYAVFNSERVKGGLPFTCSTEELELANELAPQNRSIQSDAGELLTFRIALSCTGEYATFFGGTQTGVLAAFNATMTRVNGVFEKDFSIHMNIIPTTVNVIFLNPQTDPYSTNMNQWNSQLQNTLTAVVGESNYDVGHLFGGSGGGGNAGCIGCVCVNGQKGRGITSPSDGVPMGDTFDIDYVAHELGHQFGATHTFSSNTEGSGTNVEPGSGSTIMGYAGITNQNIQFYSDDYFVYASIKQVQDNMVGKTCPVRTPILNSAPTVDAGSDYVVPKSTPFILTGSGLDAEGQPLSYTWEQNDSATSQTGNNSQASPTKVGGPNWRSYAPVPEPIRYFPPLARVLNNQLVTTFAGIRSEAISSVARELNFVLTARENVVGVGQTASDAMKVTVSDVAGPFLVTSPNTNATLVAGSNHNVTWDVAGTTANGVNAEYVDIYMTNNGGFSFPILLASKVPNDGSETVTLPSAVSTANRIMVKGHDHVFYDISNTNFATSAPGATFAVSFSRVAGEQNLSACQQTEVQYNILYETIGGFNANTTFSVSGNPAGSTATFSSSSMSSTGSTTLTIGNTAAATPGLYTIMVTATSNGVSKTVPLYLELFSSQFDEMSLITPAPNATAQSTTPLLTWAANPNATSYDVQVATDENFANIISSATVSGNSYNVPELNEGATYYWRVLPRNVSCEGNYSAASIFQTGVIACDETELTGVGLNISTQANVVVESSMEVTSNVTISDLSIFVNISHTWINDLTMTLISPSGTEVKLVNEPCTYDSIRNIIATFSDAGNPVVCGVNPGISGTVIPVDLLSAFDGESALGTWTLRVRDGYQGDGGTLNSWRLNICSAQPLSVKETNALGFMIYPNPNNGSFNIQLTSEMQDNILVFVNDIRGRQIYSKTYQNSGIFNENIQLSNVEAGIYLVTVQSGNTKEVKKIIVE